MSNTHPMTLGILITNDTDNTKGRRVGWNKKPLQQQLGLVEQWKNTNTKWEYISSHNVRTQVRPPA